MKAGVRLAALALIAMATLAGCVRLTSSTEVHADDTFSQVAIIAATADARSQLESLAKIDIGDLKGMITSSAEYVELSKKYPDQVAVEDYKDGDLSGVKITGTNLPLEAFETSFAQFTAQLPFTGKATLVRTEDTYVVSIPSGKLADALNSAGVSAGQLELLGSSVDVSLTFSFPGLVTSATAGDIDGKTVTIDIGDLAGGSDITIVASAQQQFYWKPWLMWGGIGLAVLVIVGGATALIVQDVRRHRANALPPPAPKIEGDDGGPGVLPAGETTDVTDPRGAP